jgi:hypothetical protein
MSSPRPEQAQLQDNGYEDFGVREGVKVYDVEHDIFVLFFIEENGKLRALTLGIGD